MLAKVPYYRKALMGLNVRLHVTPFHNTSVKEKEKVLSGILVPMTRLPFTNHYPEQVANLPGIQFFTH